MTRARCAADLLGVAAIGEDGLLVRDDGEYVRYLEVGSVNPLVMEQAEGERVSAAFGQLAARLPDRQSLQLYVQGTPLDLEDVLAEETHRCEQAAGAAEDAAEDERATAIRRLGIAQEQSIRATALNVAPLTLRYLVICPWRPAGRPLRSGGRSRRALRVKASVHERAMRDSLRHVEGVRSDLEAMGVPAARWTAGKCSIYCTPGSTPMRSWGASCPRASCAPRSSLRRSRARTPRTRALARAPWRARSARPSWACPSAAM